MKTFKVTNDHLRLLRNMYVWWYDAEYGAPGINPKRPYGNSNVSKDVARILKWDLKNDTLTEYQEKKAYEIHREMETVLQIFLKCGKITKGKFVNKDEYGIAWEPMS